MRQTILAVVLVALVGATIYVWYAYLRAPDVPPGGTATNLEDDRLAEYRQIKDLKPDMSIFTNPLFQSLTRYRSPNLPAPQIPGRTNPFLPF